ncbi:MAG: cation diffusion facilitator family transporter [Candidatus Kapaibacterium sp.]
MHVSSVGGNAEKEKATKNALYAGIADTGVTLSALLFSSSSVLLADFLKTTLEGVAVLLAWLSLRRIIYGRNQEFDYGIGKLESLSSVFVGVLMALAVLIIVGNSIKNILHPGHVEGLGLYISGVAQIVFGVINTKMALNSRRIAKVSPSPIITAQQQLFTTRAFGNIFILLSLSLSMALHDYTWSAYIDPVASLVIAGFIGFSAMGVFTDSFNDLLDKTLDEEYQMIILRELALHFDEYEDLHGIRSRRSGSHVFIEIFLECDTDKKVGDIQSFMDTLRKDLESKIANSRVIIGLSQERVK